MITISKEVALIMLSNLIEELEKNHSFDSLFKVDNITLIDSCSKIDNNSSREIGLYATKLNLFYMVLEALGDLEEITVKVEDSEYFKFGIRESLKENNTITVGISNKISNKVIGRKVKTLEDCKEVVFNMMMVGYNKVEYLGKKANKSTVKAIKYIEYAVESIEKSVKEIKDEN